MRQIVGALALPCPLEYFNVLQTLFELVFKKIAIAFIFIYEKPSLLKHEKLLKLELREIKTKKGAK
ncbi:hypothetical protein NIES22_52460 [Calothrix brevissima NIES-22]|nr:hypothetical protein NIES22_52460 [Calothrix brevissima NIES-22]